jgi:hypothetical protein
VRYTTMFDIVHASIDTTFAYQIDQLAYTDPTHCIDVFNDLAVFEPDLVYEVLDSNPAGLHRFNLRKWPTDVRYECDTSDGWSEPGGEADLRDMVTIIGVDVRGRPVSKQYSQTVPELAQWGRHRDADQIDLGAELWSDANADQVGAQILAQTGSAQISGTLTVARPIIDLYTGRQVSPHELEPGYNINIRDLAATSLRINDMSYRHSDRSAALTVGNPVLTTDQIVKRLAKNRKRPST